MQKWIKAILALGLVIATGYGCGGGGGGGASQPATRAVGLDFSPYLNGQSPNLGTQISQSQLTSRMQVIAADTQWIRTYSVSNGLQSAGSIAHNLGLKAAIGAYLGTDTNANQQEIANLISIGQQKQADILIVGSESLQSGYLTAAQLVAYINQVKQAVPTATVTTADTFNMLLANPSVIAACDVVMMNYYPYFSGVSIDGAIADFQAKYQQVKAAASGKFVYVSETGWPSAGNTIGAAVPSQDNAGRYLREFVSWANTNRIFYFYFESFDEAWKATVDQPQESHWGIRDSTGTYKPGTDSVFKLQLTNVPAYGDTSGMLYGIVGKAYRSSAYKISVYINVGGQWYNKPYDAAPLTDIQSDGSWNSNIVTGGTDQNATRIVAFLVSTSYNPPIVDGLTTLPAQLDQSAIARAEITRSP